jgi:hypothetical protein
VAIADLTILRDDDELAPEALVRFLAGDSAGARAVIVDWAGVVGYRRVWFSDELVELPGPVEGVADTRCSGCAARFVDAEPGFWAHVRTAGRFPAMCPLCGGDLPQWRVREARPALAARDRVKPRRR